MATDTPINVLLIQDNPTDVRLVQEILRDISSDRFTVVTASTLAQGLKRLAADHVDVVLLDLGLPDSQGFDTFRAVNERAPDLPIIVLTVSTDEEIGLKAIRAGAQRFFSKDVLIPDSAYAEIFRQMIRYAIERKRVETTLQRRDMEVRRLNMELASTTQELRALNEGLERRVANRTEELEIANEELLREITACITAERDVEARAHNTAALNAIIHVLNEALDLPTLYERALTTIIHQLRFDSGVVGTVTDSARVTMQYAYNLPPETVDAFNRLNVDDDSLMRAIYREQKPLVLDETSSVLESHRFGQHGAVVAIPYTSEGVTNGVIALYAADRRSFTPADRELFQMIGLEFGTAVARIQAKARAEEHARWQSILTRIISAGNNATSLHSALVAVLDTSLELLNLDNGGIFLRDGDAMVLQHERGYTAEQRAWTQRIPITQHRIAHIMDGTPWISDDYQVDATPEVREMNKDVASMATVPLMAGDVIVGFYQLVSVRQPHHFTDEERTLLVSIGREAGTVIARLQAEATISTQARHTALLNKIILYGNTTTNAQDFLQYACDLLVKEYGYDAVDMRIITEKEDIAEQVAVTGFPAEFNTQYRFMSIDDPILRGVYHGKPYFPARYTKTHVDLVHATGMESVGIVPFAVGETTIGDMGVALKDYRPFSPDERALLVSLGRETGTVLARLQAEGQVRAGSRYVRSLIEASLDPLVTISAGGLITDVNKATEAVTGYSRDELIGSDFSDYFTEPEKAQAGYQKVFADGSIRDYPLTLRHKFGNVIDVLYNATVYRDEAGEVQGAFAAARDITDRKRAEEELQRYSDHLEDLVEERTSQLKDAERLAAIGQTATMIGHDLRNPLQALQLLVDLAGTYYNDIPPELKGRFDAVTAERIFSSVEQQIKYMDKIVSDLQDYSRPLVLKSEVVNLAEFVADTLALLMIPESVGVNVNVADSITARVDPHLMQRALSNLIMNAVQAMPQGGELTIDATARDHTVAITIHDTGEGVPEGMKERLFSPLTTGKAKGTGLGLAVVKRIVEAHGGTITFESEKGRGTKFTATLPQTADD